MNRSIPREMQSKETIEAWIRSFRAGDSVAFSHLYASYQPMLHHTVSAMGLHREDGEGQSVADEAFHSALLHWDADAGASFGTYAKRCVENALKRLLRSRATQAPLVGVDVDTIPTGGGAESSLVRRESEERTLALVRSIASDEEYRVFYCILWRGESVAEYQLYSGKTRKQVENARARLLKKLKQYPELYAQLTT